MTISNVSEGRQVKQSKDANGDGRPSEKQQQALALVSVSRCEIQGVVVNVQRKSHGVVLYLIDDGTGFIDCLDYEEDYYSLPSLDKAFHNTGNSIDIGDTVSIRGKIRVVAVDNDGTVHREVHVSCIERLDGHRADANALHWLRCIQMTKNQTAMSLLNGDHVLHALGENFAAKLQSGELAQDLQHFGKACKCNLPQKDTLLYCHCHATPETLDPMFTFRDAVLLKLLEIEASLPATDTSPLCFLYKDIVADTNLTKIALETVSATSMPTVNKKRLFVNTFRALRDDGVVYLLDVEKDEYMLLSKSRVLEPHVRELAQFPWLRFNPPNYLVRVPYSRLKHVSRYMGEAKRQDNCNLSS